jgi:hypothetical protein
MFDYLASPVLSRKRSRRALIGMADRRELYHTIGWTYADGAGGATLADAPAITDAAFTIVNNHLIFTEQYNVLAAYGIGANLTAAELSSPSLNAYGLHHFLSLNAHATPTASHVLDDYRSWPMPIPQVEEIACKQSNNAGAATQTTLLANIATPNWSRQLPSGMMRMTMQATASVVLGAFAWGADIALTFEQKPKGGWWTIVGCRPYGTNLIAARFNFIRQPLINGRKFYPGVIEQNTQTLPIYYDSSWMGPMGTFHTFEPPLVSGIGTAAGAQTITFEMDMIFHGDNPPAGSTSGVSI